MSHEHFLAAHEEALREAAAVRGGNEMIARILGAQVETITAQNLIGIELGPAVCGISVRPEVEAVERELALAQVHLGNARNAVLAIKHEQVTGKTADQVAVEARLRVAETGA